jgi:anion-transporting  ArsA/GET3 family ATPase
MTGLNEAKDVFGTMTVAFLIELVVAVVGIIIAYKKLKDKIIGSYKERKQQQDDIDEALTGVRNMPKYREQSIEIQQQLKNADEKILETCNKIQDGVNENQRILNERLDRLEDRERNSLRAKILEMHRLFTSKKNNPMQAWTEMERDAFNDLIVDYESLNGNGHVHTVVIPEMNMLRVIPMWDHKAIAELFHSREA